MLAAALWRKGDWSCSSKWIQTGGFFAGAELLRGAQALEPSVTPSLTEHPLQVTPLTRPKPAEMSLPPI